MDRPLASLLGALLFLSLPAPGAPAEALRVCADPDNLPFSRAEGSERGLYVDLAELVAARLGLRPEYTWFVTNYGRRAVRSTLLADRCDAYFGLPDDDGFMGRSVTRTRPFLDVGYVLIGLAPFAASSLDDIQPRRVAVQFGTQPQLILATRPGFHVVTFRLAEEALEALARREVDVAFLWGPTAGYYNKTRLGGTYRIVPVAGPGLQWQVTVGVRKDNDALKADLDRVLDHLKPEVMGLAAKYGFPLGRPVGIERQGGAARSPRFASDPFQPIQQTTGKPTTHRSELGPGSTPPERDAWIRLGRSLFNRHCSHCHAPNAMSPEPSRDLRRLKLRYGVEMTETAYTTITRGRLDKGMPAWKDLLDDDAIRNILTFLKSVQREP
jgi:polar amino acid transport system substrate-binding protein